VALVTVAAGLLLLVWAGFALSSGERRVHGVITEVVARDIGHTETIAVRGDDGRTYRFRVAEDELKTPGHLREHMTYGLPITVYYRQVGDELVTVRLVD
jgi:hypothetical protein